MLFFEFMCYTDYESLHLYSYIFLKPAENNKTLDP